jgi:hypothetical protein
MTIEFIIRRRTLYGLLIIFIIRVYLTSILLFDKAFQGFLNYESALTRLPAALAIAPTFLPLRNRIEIWINRLFSRAQVKASLGFGAGIPRCFGSQFDPQIVESFLTLCADGLKIRSSPRASALAASPSILRLSLASAFVIMSPC